MMASAQVTAPGAVTSMIVAMRTRPNRQNRSTCSRMSVPLFRFQFGLRMDCCILNGSLRFVTRELEGECNQSCQQYRSDNSVSPKPAPKRFLILRIEPLILIDDLSAHRPLLPTNQTRWGALSGPNRGRCVNCFTFRIIIVLMETIKDLYIAP